MALQVNWLPGNKYIAVNIRAGMLALLSTMLFNRGHVEACPFQIPGLLDPPEATGGYFSFFY